jgi:hypothetical protein
VYIEIQFQSASTDGLRKFIESVRCPIDEITPSLDSAYSVQEGHPILRYITCCKELNGLLKRKVSALHSGVAYQESTD